jgi:hypothetical protein
MKLIDILGEVSSDLYDRLSEGEEWYYFYGLSEGGACDFCGSYFGEFRLVRLQSPEAYSHIYESDEDIIADESQWVTACSMCLMEIKVAQRDLYEEQFFENIDRERERYELVCLRCGWVAVLFPSVYVDMTMAERRRWARKEKEEHQCRYLALNYLKGRW